ISSSPSAIPIEYLRSVPTRRSSDLENVAFRLMEEGSASEEEIEQRVRESLRFVELEHTLNMFPAELSGGMRRRMPPESSAGNMRSEEHTSELQSHLNLVFRLLLEKK